MPSDIEFLPDDAERSQPLFATEKEYAAFRESFAEEVASQQREWLEVRRKSEEEARLRFIR